jgi:hypothetical protein
MRILNRNGEPEDAPGWLFRISGQEYLMEFDFQEVAWEHEIIVFQFDSSCGGTETWQRAASCRSHTDSRKNTKSFLTSTILFVAAFSKEGVPNRSLGPRKRANDISTYR